MNGFAANIIAPSAVTLAMMKVCGNVRTSGKRFS